MKWLSRLALALLFLGRWGMADVLHKDGLFWIEAGEIHFCKTCTERSDSTRALDSDVDSWLQKNAPGVSETTLRNKIERLEQEISILSGEINSALSSQVKEAVEKNLNQRSKELKTSEEDLANLSFLRGKMAGSMIFKVDRGDSLNNFLNSYSAQIRNALEEVKKEARETMLTQEHELFEREGGCEAKCLYALPMEKGFIYNNAGYLRGYYDGVSPYGFVPIRRGGSNARSKLAQGCQDICDTNHYRRTCKIQQESIQCR